MTGRGRDRIRAWRVTVQPGLGDHSGLASEDSARVVSLGPFGLRFVIRSVPYATFRHRVSFGSLDFERSKRSGF